MQHTSNTTPTPSSNVDHPANIMKNLLDTLQQTMTDNAENDDNTNDNTDDDSLLNNELLANLGSIHLAEDIDRDDESEGQLEPDENTSNSGDNFIAEFGDSFPASFIQQNLAELLQGATSQPETKYQLQVCFANEDTESLYTVPEHPPRPGADAGWDLHCPETVTIAPNTTHMLDFEVSLSCTTDCVTPIPLLLLPRSSISKTPLRLANSVGLIDAGYRGHIKAAVDNCSDEPYEVTRGDRLFQLVAMPTQAMQWSVVESLSETDRGAGGFGSTGR
jgi:dUTP pyrophosphatase